MMAQKHTEQSDTMDFQGPLTLLLPNSCPRCAGDLWQVVDRGEPILFCKRCFVIPPLYVPNTFTTLRKALEVTLNMTIHTAIQWALGALGWSQRG